jgi:hypothetical protein
VTKVWSWLRSGVSGGRESGQNGPETSRSDRWTGRQNNRGWFWVVRDRSLDLLFPVAAMDGWGSACPILHPQPRGSVLRFARPRLSG